MKLTRAQLDRIAKVVKQVENQPANLVSDLGLLPRNPPFWAKIESYNSSTHLYAWSKQKYASTPALADDVPTSGGIENAYEVNGVIVSKGTKVLLFFAGYDGSGKPVYAFLSPAAYVLFAVKVTQTGGSAGSNSTACSFTYTVKDLNLNTLGTGLAPKKKRTSVGEYVAPAANSIGTAYTDETGTLCLFDANEVPAVEVCE